MAGTDRLSRDDARHLLARAAFGPTVALLDELTGRTRAEAVARLAGKGKPALATAPPSWKDEGPPSMAERLDRRAQRKTRKRRGRELQAWWLGEMMSTEAPLLERMVLFWHGHFTSSLQKVKHPQLMWRQNQLLREQALGRFDRLLHAIARDPAMVLYLDGQSNQRKAPNENFAREVLELFTLGEGQGYTEADIKEAARAFTGWRVDKKTGEVKFRRRRHDAGEKTLLGRTGRFDGADVLDIVLSQPRTAVHIAERLWAAFVGGTPDALEVHRIARQLRSGWDLRAAVTELLVSDAFYAPERRATVIKSPVELVVGTVRALQLEPDDLQQLSKASARLGQALLNPPNVKGWPGGTLWIDANTLLLRQELMSKAVRASRTMRPVFGAGADVEELLLAMPPIEPAPADATVAERVESCLMDPTYQLA